MEQLIIHLIGSTSSVQQKQKAKIILNIKK
jgi:hypothetical protein